MIIHLKEFIKTGYWGSLSLGSSKKDLINLLGDKYDFGDIGETQIIKYGWYEFFYWTDSEKIFGIQNDHLPADCANHNKMIHYRNRRWSVDVWFLKTGQNFTFKEVTQLLEQENIAYSIEPLSPRWDENIIRCTESNVTFDFVNEYQTISLNEKGKFNGWVEKKETHQDDYVLNGVRLFNL